MRRCSSRRSFRPLYLRIGRGRHTTAFPSTDRGLVKVAKHYHLDQQGSDPDNYDRVVSDADEAEIRSGIVHHLPEADGPMRRSETCLYTNTPDKHFIVDHVHPHSIVASPCSGHGFKFAPVIGEILADLATRGSTKHDIRRFGLDRFR
jgi:sarcosine oxidase